MKPHPEYDGYEAWRRRSSTHDREGQDPRTLLTEIRRARLPPGASIFEVGFGRGHFLRWARSRGYPVGGCEIVEPYVSDARRQGFPVELGGAEEVLGRFGSAFDAVVMLDVVEHVSLEDLPRLFAATSGALRSEGIIVIRMPNGASPFGRLTQYGDVTHRSCLTPGSIEQLANGAGLRLSGVYNSARSYRMRTWRSPFKIVVFAIRTLIEVFVGYLYFGRRVPLDPNMTLILRKSRRDEDPGVE